MYLPEVSSSSVPQSPSPGLGMLGYLLTGTNNSAGVYVRRYKYYTKI